jgi:hypothetical protein
MGSFGWGFFAGIFEGVLSLIASSLAQNFPGAARDGNGETRSVAFARRSLETLCRSWAAEGGGGGSISSR